METQEPGYQKPDGYAADGTPIYKVELKKGQKPVIPPAEKPDGGLVYITADKEEVPPAEKRPAYLTELANMTPLSDLGVMKANTKGETQKYLLEHANEPYAKELLEKAQRLYYLDLIDSGEKPESLSGYYDMVAADLRIEKEGLQVKKRRDGKTVYESIPLDNVLKEQDNSPGSKLAAAALRHYGKPYRLGGKGDVNKEPGLDCSGLVYKAIKDVYGNDVAAKYKTSTRQLYKKTIGQSSWSWNSKNGGMPDTAMMKEGDLVFVSKGSNKQNADGNNITHIMIYMGNGIVMDASSIDGDGNSSKLERLYPVCRKRLLCFTRCARI